MKVICIDAKNQVPCLGCGSTDNGIEENKTYVGRPYEGSLIIDGYENCRICGYPHAFRASRFIPLSEIDETEFVREENLVNH